MEDILIVISKLFKEIGELNAVCEVLLSKNVSCFSVSVTVAITEYSVTEESNLGLAYSKSLIACHHGNLKRSHGDCWMSEQSN